MAKAKDNAAPEVKPAEVKQAPITTDAAAITPQTAAEVSEKPAALPNTVPARDEVKTATGAGDLDGRPVVAGTVPVKEADDTDDFTDGPTVAQLVARFRDFAAAVKSGEWRKAMQLGAEITFAVAHVFDSLGLSRTSAADAEALGTADSVGLMLATCRADAGAKLAGVSSVSLKGETGPDLAASGTPQPLNPANRVKGADAAGMDPATILVLIELVTKLWAAFRKRS